MFGDIVTDIPDPKDRKIMFKDIVVGGVVKSDKAGTLIEGCYKMFIKDRDRQDKYLRKRIINNFQTPPLIYVDSKVRTVNKVEMCRLQGFPDDWCDILTKSQTGSLLGDGWTLPIIEHIFSFIER